MLEKITKLETLTFVSLHAKLRWWKLHWGLSFSLYPRLIFALQRVKIAGKGQTTTCPSILFQISFGPYSYNFMTQLGISGQLDATTLFAILMAINIVRVWLVVQYISYKMIFFLCLLYAQNCASMPNISLSLSEDRTSN